MLLMKHILLLSIIALVKSASILQPLANFDCTNLNINSKHYNFSALNKDFTITKNSSTPPTIETTTVRLNICDRLTQLPEYNALDQCPTNTWVCLMITNIKGDSPRVTQVRPISQGNFDMPKVTVNPLSGLDLVIELAGGSYNGVAQLANITMACDAKETDIKPPEDYKYENNVLSILWKTAAACGSDPNDDGGDRGRAMSGASIFFLVLFLIMITYCILGSAFNYTILRVHRFPEVLPNWNIWERLLGNIVDMIGSIYDRFSGRYVRL